MEINVDNISRDVQRLIDTFIAPTVSSQWQFARTPALGQRQIDAGKLSRQFKKKTFEILLSHRDDNRAAADDLTIYDCLYAICYDKRLKKKTLEAGRLSELVDGVRAKPTDDVESVLTFLLHLAQANGERVNCIGHESWRSDFSCRRRMPDKSPTAPKSPIYQEISSYIFEADGLCVESEPQFQAFNSKVFSLHPGFETRNRPLKCSLSWSSDTHTPVASTLFGALIHPLSDPWQIGTILDLPELDDEAPRGFRAHQNFYRRRAEPRISISLTDVSSRTETVRSDEDEGFVENDSPCSAASSRRLMPDRHPDDIWELALRQTAPPDTVRRTWESLGCPNSQLERPLLSEAGPLALDNVALGQRHELSIIFPHLHQRQVVPLRPVVDVVRDALRVLLGIESKTFELRIDSCSFLVPECRCTGLTPEALDGVLAEFADAGTDHLRLEQFVAVASDTGGGYGKVARCLAAGVRRFLLQKCAVIDCWLAGNEFRPGSNGSGLGFLSCLERTSTLRKQTRFVAELCLVAPESDATLPAGVRLLAHIHAASVDSSSDSDLHPIALALLRRAAEPYFRFVASWAFDGRWRDESDEFPIRVDPELCACADVRFWSDGFQLVADEDEEPVLGPLLRATFVCGKSLRLLRLCNDGHRLFQRHRVPPTLSLTFSKSKLRQADKECRLYFAEVEADTMNFVAAHEQRRKEDQRLREAVLIRARETSQRRLREHLIERALKQENKTKQQQKVFQDICEQIKAKTATEEKSENRSEETTVDATMTDLTANSSPTSLVETDGLSFASDLNSPIGTEDANANLIEYAAPNVATRIQLATPTDDVNANPEPAPVLRLRDDLNLKGVKRKQDRESIDFEVQQAARRSPPRVTFLAEATTNGERSRRSVVFDDDWQLGENTPTDLVEGSTFQVLRTRGRSVHGHASDSTIQKLIYGNTAAIDDDRFESPASVTSKKDAASGSIDSALESLSNLKISAYAKTFPELTSYHATSDIFKSTTQPRKDDGDDEDYKDLAPLPVVLQTCIYYPLQAQASIVNHALLNFFLIDCQLEQHFDFVRNHFFLQDGEFGQRLCELLFERVSHAATPAELLNLVSLNSILAKSYTYCSWVTTPSPGDPPATEETKRHQPVVTSDHQNNLSFAVKFFPSSFRLNSPGVLDCLKLVYRTQFPSNIVFSPEASRYYESIFSFLLQLRYCMWTLLEAYQLLKANAPPTRSQRPLSACPYHPRHYRLLMFYRQEMHFFVRSLLEYLNLQAFQITFIDFNKKMLEVTCLDELIALHIKYLQKISFRCLLHNKAAPLQKILQSTLSFILTFCSKLHPPADGVQMSEEEVLHIQATYEKFKRHSHYLFEVLTKAVNKGYNPPLREFLMRLDYNGYFTKSLFVCQQPLDIDDDQVRGRSQVFVPSH